MQTLDAIPSSYATTQQIFCCYVNATDSIQVARITNVENWYFERVVFPGQRLIFAALSHAKLEIHSGMMASSVLSDTLDCMDLQVQESVHYAMGV